MITMIQSILKRPVKTWWLTASFMSLCLLYFIVYLIADFTHFVNLYYELTVSTASLTLNGQAYRLVSAMWVQNGFLNVLGNLFAIFYFGVYAEFYYGKLYYGALFLLGGIAGNLASAGYHLQALLVPVAEQAQAKTEITFGIGGALVAVLTGLLVASFLPKPQLDPNLAPDQNATLMFLGLSLIFGVITTGQDLALLIGSVICGLIFGFGHVLAQKQTQISTQRAIALLVILMMAGGLTAVFFLFKQQIALV